LTGLESLDTFECISGKKRSKKHRAVSA